jgi:hypothetical protein
MIRIDFESGDFQYVTLPIARYPIAAAIRDDFRKAIGNCEFWDAAIDATLFRLHDRHYRKIAELMEPPFDPAELTTRSRHEFFVCGEVKGDAVMLTGLDQLLGYVQAKAIATEPSEFIEAPKATITTGSPYLDLLAAAIAVLGANALPLLDRCSYGELAAIVSQSVRSGDPKAIEEDQRKMDVEFLDNLFGTNNEATGN